MPYPKGAQAFDILHHNLSRVHIQVALRLGNRIRLREISSRTVPSWLQFCGSPVVENSDATPRVFLLRFERV